MARIEDVWDHERVLPLAGHGLLLGDPSSAIYLSARFAAWTDLAAAKAIGVEGVNDHSVVELEVEINFHNHFLVDVVRWSRLNAAAADDDLNPGNNTAVRAYLIGGNGTQHVLVGRTDTNQVLVQAGAGYAAPASEGDVRVQVFTTTVGGGLIQRLVSNVGQRHLICMQTENAAQPAHPAGVHYDGRSPGAVAVAGNVTWHPAGSRALSTDPKTWFAFGEARLNPQSGQWDVQDTWYVIDASDSFAISFSHSWGGPTWSHPYDVNTHRYARLRLADGSNVVRRIGTSGGPLDRGWIPLTQQFVDGSAYRASPYTARTSFDYYPADFRLIKFRWDWETPTSVIDGATHRNAVETFMDSGSIVASQAQTRSATQWATRRSGPVLALHAERDHGLRVSRSAITVGTGGSATSLRMTVQFEGGSNGELPITHLRFIERQYASARGWLRTFVL